MTDPLGTRLAAALGPAYEIIGLLGKGGMGAVYRATDRRLRREVAVKVLPPELGYASDLRARFVREAQMAAQLSHPHIVPVFDVGERDDLVWFTMAFVDGESVRAKVEREGPQPITVVRRVLQEVAQALAYAHARGVIHRDIKPDNIMLDRGSGRSLVADFGIAKALTGDDTEVTQPGEVVGTARYMAPEQALAEPVDARADMYSLGLVGYFMLTGTHAIKGGSLHAVMAEYVKGAAIDLKAAERRLPAPLVTALERALAAKPDGRFARMEEFAEALRDLGGDLPDTPAPVRKLLRETERTFVTATLGAFALGYVGIENVPLNLIMLVGGGVVGQWAVAIEQSARRGVTWSVIRRALYVERARRVDEIQDAGPPVLGLASSVAIVGLITGAIVFLPSEASGQVNAPLFFVGMFGSLVAAKLFALPQFRSKSMLSNRTATMLYGGLLIIVIGMIGAMLVGFREALGNAEGFVVLGTAILTGLFLGLGAVAVYRVAKWIERTWGAGKAAAVDTVEWRVPRWLDVVGSWLFARIERHGWRIRVDRNRPMAAAEARLGVSAARQVEKRIRQLAFGVSDTGAGVAWEARHLAKELVAECRRAEQELKPLLARIARLSEGVLISRTIAAGGSIESELDRAERDADALRAHAKDCGDMLDALAAGLETLAASKDTAGLDSAIRRARQLSSGVRKLILRAENA